MEIIDLNTLATADGQVCSVTLLGDTTILEFKNWQEKMYVYKFTKTRFLRVSDGIGTDMDGWQPGDKSKIAEQVKANQFKEHIPLEELQYYEFYCGWQFLPVVSICFLTVELSEKSETEK